MFYKVVGLIANVFLTKNLTGQENINVLLDYFIECNLSPYCIKNNPTLMRLFWIAPFVFIARKRACDSIAKA